MKFVLILLTLLLAAPDLPASRRGEAPRLDLSLSAHERFTEERYDAEIPVFERGFVYLYSLDGNGYVSLLYPTAPSDGRGEVAAGDTLRIEHLYAGTVPGIERIVAVHTLEHREIRASRHQFKAPNPEDLQKVHERLTRSSRELGNYVEVTLQVLSLHEAGGAEVAIEEDTYVEANQGAGLVVHHHVYDYWCPYCDCWHPSCTPGHCWCGWEVVSHYHHHYHYSHCFLWGHWHGWWRPPMIYVYIRGGSSWDYDTRPWRGRMIWGVRREDSRRWREASSPEVKPDIWSDIGPRSKNDEPDFLPMRRRIATLDARDTTVRTWSTEDLSGPDIGSKRRSTVEPEPSIEVGGKRDSEPPARREAPDIRPRVRQKEQSKARPVVPAPDQGSVKPQPKPQPAPPAPKPNRRTVKPQPKPEPAPQPAPKESSSKQ